MGIKTFSAGADLKFRGDELNHISLISKRDWKEFFFCSNPIRQVHILCHPKTLKSALLSNFPSPSLNQSDTIVREWAIKEECLVLIANRPTPISVDPPCPGHSLHFGDCQCRWSNISDRSCSVFLNLPFGDSSRLSLTWTRRGFL